jgi:hypothetical protein
MKEVVQLCLHFSRRVVTKCHTYIKLRQIRPIEISGSAVLSLNCEQRSCTLCVCVKSREKHTKSNRRQFENVLQFYTH